MKKSIIILGIACLVLGALILLYLLVVQPAAEKYILDKQQQAYTIGLMYAQNFMLTEIANSLTTNGYVKVTFPNNQSVMLIPYQGGAQQ